VEELQGCVSKSLIRMTLSELINQAVCGAIREDCDERALEPTLTFEEMLRRLDLDGKI
jgi:hypothetical protein